MTDHATSTPTGDDAAQSEYCPYFQHAVELIGRRWTGSILKLLGARSLRFGELRDGIPGLSDRLLTARLAELESEGVVSRATCGGETRYELTAKGRGLEPVFAAVVEWSHTYAAQIPDTAPGRRRC